VHAKPHHSIKDYFARCVTAKKQPKDPTTNLALKSTDMFANLELRNMIHTAIQNEVDRTYHTRTNNAINSGPEQ